MPFSPNSTDVLSVESMTEAVNEIKPVNDFLFTLLFSGNPDPKPTHTIELSYIRRDGHKMAPFVKRGSAARMIEGHTGEFRIVEPPHIRISRPMTPTRLFTERRPGDGIFSDEAQIRASISRYMAQELRNLTDAADESIEWLCAQMLTGTATYDDSKNVAWEIVIPRSPSHDYDLVATYHWDEVNGNIANDFITWLTLINDDASLMATDVILGSEAADWFLNNAAMQALLKNNQSPGIVTGGIDFTTQMQQNGALFLGAPFRGLRVWRYARTVTMDDGTVVDLIRPKYAEVVSVTPAAKNVMYYGAIHDLDALDDGQPLARARFSKTWRTNDPSAQMSLLETNPLPCLRRPDSTISAKVVSG